MLALMMSSAFLNILARAASLVLGMPFVHIILDTLYDNMMSALKGDQAGLFFLDCLWRWINALISAICAIRWRRSQGSAQTFEMAPNLDNVKIWFSDMVRHQKCLIMSVSHRWLGTYSTWCTGMAQRGERRGEQDAPQPRR